MAGPKTPKDKSTGDGAVGYGKPPKATQFKPGQTGNPGGKPKGLPSAQEVLVEEAARLVKMKVGDQVVPMSKLRGLFRRLFDIGLGGDISAIRLALAYIMPAFTAIAEVAPLQEIPLTEEELDVLKLLSARPKGSAP